MKLTENTKVKIRVPKHLYEAIQAELDKKHMEEGGYGHEEMEEGEYGHDEPMEENQDLKEIMTGAEFDANRIASIFKIDPFLGGLILVGGVFLGIISLPKAIQLAKVGAAVMGDKAGEILSKIKKMFLKTKFGKSPEVDKLEPSAAGADQQTEEYQLEEVLDLETLLEAVNDAAKKKKEKDAKKKAEEKKEAENKKKKEAEAKKKAEAAKKK